VNICHLLLKTKGNLLIICTSYIVKPNYRAMEYNDKEDKLGFPESPSEKKSTEFGKLLPDKQTSKVKNLYECSITKLACFHEVKNGQLNSIVRSTKYEGDGGYPWYHYAFTIVKVWLESGSSTSLQEGVLQLGNTVPNPDDWRDPLNIKYSKAAVESLLNTNLPLKFRSTKKLISKSPNRFSYQGIDLKASSPSIFIFTCIVNGESLVGGFILHCAKEQPLKKGDLGVSAHLMNLYLKEHFESEEVQTPEELCIAIDVNTKEFSEAFSATSVPAWRIKKMVAEFKQRWKLL
jgi:hypothetical protein